MEQSYAWEPGRGTAGPRNRVLVLALVGKRPLDRLANASYQIVIEGSSYQERLSFHRALLGKGSRILTKNGD